MIWEITLDIIKENPLFGAGFNQYNTAFGKQQAEYFRSEKYSEDKAMVAGKGEYAFNELLHISAEHGLIGLILFLSIVVSALEKHKYKKAKYKDSSSAVITGASGGMISILVFSLFSYPFSVTPILLNFFFFPGHTVSS